MSIYGTGLVLHHTHSWTPIFETAAVVYGAGALAYLAWADTKEQFQ